MTKLDKLWFLIPAGLLFLALVPMPYGYYQFIRIAVSIAAGVIAYTSFNDGKQGWAIIFGGICVLFNPIFPIYLSREIWAPIDIVAALIFLGGWKMTRKTSQS